MSEKKNYPSRSRAARFLLIRDAIFAHSKRMRRAQFGGLELQCGPFLIHYLPPGAMLGRPYNMQIWPYGAEDLGHIVHQNKVANVDWDQWDNVDIISFRSGPWERELLNLLDAPPNLGFLAPQRRYDDGSGKV